MVRFSTALLFLLSSNSLLEVVEAECDACKWDGTDIEDCKEYGYIDDELVGWEVASADCLDAYGNNIASPDPSASCASANSFVNALRFGDLASSTAKLGLGMAEGGFFTQDSNENPILKDSITVDGTTYDCTVSEADCYNAMKPYFATSAGQTEMMQVCDVLANQGLVDRQLEQSTTRTRLCQELNSGTVIATGCETLSSQVSEKMAEYPDKDCSAYAFGMGTSTVPGCEANATDDATGDDMDDAMGDDMDDAMGDDMDDVMGMDDDASSAYGTATMSAVLITMVAHLLL
jgi:hypothetical protein